MDIEDEIFGGDSDLSDLEEEQAPGGATAGIDFGDDEEDEEAGGDDDDEEGDEGDRHGDGDFDAGDEWQAQGAPKKGRKKKTRKTAGEGGEGMEEDGVGGEGAPRKKKKPRKAPLGEPAEPEEPAVVDPVLLRRQEINARLDAIIKPNKAKRRKRKGDEDDLELLADEEVARLRQAMLTAAQNDIEACEEKRPVVNKLAMLPEVLTTMQKSALQDAILEGGLLEAVKKWLEPLPDKSLPTLNIQRSLLDILLKMNIDTPTLKSSELGRVMLFYAKCKRTEPSIKRTADQLVMNWMRPILRLSATYRDRPVPVADTQSSQQQRSYNATRRRANRDRTLQPAVTNKGVERRHAIIPQTISTAYTVAPPNKAVEKAGGKGSKDAKIREFKKRLTASQSQARRL